MRGTFVTSRKEWLQQPLLSGCADVSVQPRAPPGNAVLQGDGNNATPALWHELAFQLAGTGDAFDGFAVVHGTDTLAYAASALSFLLADFDKPVIVTGSQIPLREVRHDAQGIPIGAMQAIATGRVDEVAVCFGRYLLRGNRAGKIQSTPLDAFQSPNSSALAEIGSAFRFADVAPRPLWLSQSRSPSLRRRSRGCASRTARAGARPSRYRSRTPAPSCLARAARA